jgi:twitching motility two-component system response regulator PilG
MLELSTQESEVLACMDTPSKQTMVVVIDDSPTICKILEISLHREGYEVVTYLNPVQALQALLWGEVARPDVLLVNLVLPQMNGYEVMRRLRAKPEFKAVPIIAITGREGMLDRLKARLAGANDYVIKPFKTQYIVDLVQKYTSPASN